MCVCMCMDVLVFLLVRVCVSNLCDSYYVFMAEVKIFSNALCWNGYFIVMAFIVTTHTRVCGN